MTKTYVFRILMFDLLGEGAQRPTNTNAFIWKHHRGHTHIAHKQNNEAIERGYEHSAGRTNEWTKRRRLRRRATTTTTTADDCLVHRTHHCRDPHFGQKPRNMELFFCWLYVVVVIVVVVIILCVAATEETKQKTKHSNTITNNLKNKKPHSTACH